MPMVPSFCTEVVTPPPMSMVPSTVMVPELVLGPCSDSPGWGDVPVEPTVSDPLFCRPSEMLRPGPGELVPAAPMVRLLPAESVSSPMEDDTSVTVTFAPPEMQTLTPAPFGTPALQLAAEPQSPEALPATQLSLQLGVSPGDALPKTVDDASNTVVVPATTRSPATTAPARLAMGRWKRPAAPCNPAWPRPTLPSPRPSSGRHPFAHAQLGASRSIVSAARWEW